MEVWVEIFRFSLVRCRPDVDGPRQLCRHAPAVAVPVNLLVIILYS